MKDEGTKFTRKEKRLKILATDEIESIYNRPKFNSEDQIEYFTLSQSDLEILEVFGSIKSQVYFIRKDSGLGLTEIENGLMC